ncbi:hypothetical protein GCM10022236_25800 [Microlunatus ginsengisoli]|uniref:Uncharacterized protein n=1 Tax=Microlunatus ginsengisoli TaxID=363863 RepID=A0ABP6ZYN2_9ACTN
MRIRRRKPWVRLRRRLLGWKVRLLTGKLRNRRSMALQRGRRTDGDLLTVRGSAKRVKPPRTYAPGRAAQPVATDPADRVNATRRRPAGISAATLHDALRDC